MRCSEIRRRFVEYYQKLDFQLLPRAPMMHPSIPMSFVMSAGLVQVETSLANSKNRSGNKFVLVQDCFRHFDLSGIGTDNMHLSLFEMPGAFMFGLNERFEPIKRMWEIATDVLGVSPKKLWATFFSGDTLGSQRLPRDRETYDAWKKIGISENHLVGLGLKDNYWVQGGGMQHIPGSFRKCGPNTELFYDLGEEYSCCPSCQPGCRCGQRFLEFSNSLFISSSICPDTQKLFSLDDPFTETVIGTERVAMILQDTPSVFSTIFYQPIIAAIHSFVTNTDIPSKLMQESEWVIADHIRALYILVSDGAPPPGKNGRERIVKLLIRGILTRKELLGISSPDFLDAALHAIIESISVGNGFHRLTENTLQTIHLYVDCEAERFEKTIQRGIRKMYMMLECDSGRQKTLPGKQIVELEKGMGLPLPLIVHHLQKRGLVFDETEYAAELKNWRKNYITG